MFLVVLGFEFRATQAMPPTLLAFQVSSNIVSHFRPLLDHMDPPTYASGRAGIEVQKYAQLVAEMKSLFAQSGLEPRYSQSLPCFLRQRLCTQNSLSSCLSLLGAGITGMTHHT
jgi:hypothetical protein